MSLELEYLRYSELPFCKHFNILKGRLVTNHDKDGREKITKKIHFPNCIAFIN